MVSTYKKENDNWKKENSNLLKIIGSLNEKLLGKEEDSQKQEIKGTANLLRLLRENE